MSEVLMRKQGRTDLLKLKARKKNADMNNNNLSHHCIMHIFCGNFQRSIFPPVPSSKPIPAPERLQHPNHPSQNPRFSKQNGIHAVLEISMKELTSRRREFLDGSWSAEFQLHLHSHFVDAAYLLHHKHQWGWHGEGKTKQELSQLRMFVTGG
jgi:hypothetical protein